MRFSVPDNCSFVHTISTLRTTLVGDWVGTFLGRAGPLTTGYRTALRGTREHEVYKKALTNTLKIFTDCLVFYVMVAVFQS